MSKYTPSGDPYTRGGMDSYYRREFNPHYLTEGVNHLGNKCTVRISELTHQERINYFDGFYDNEKDGDHKDWG